MNGEVRVVDDVAAAFAEHVAEAMRQSVGEPFVVGASGGNSGRACFGALASRTDVDFGRIVLYFADERCVDPTSPDANQRVIADALGSARDRLAAFYPMSCPNGPAAYEARLREANRFDVLQLGLGPDGHTASLFPGSSALSVTDGRLVTTNRDVFGDNPFDRLTLTFAGIALARSAVITVIGEGRAGVLARIAEGEDLPAGRVQAGALVWLVDREAASLLPAELRRG